MPTAVFGICVALLLASSGTPVFANDAVGNLPTIQVFKKVKENYASMVTYSDEGKVVSSMNGDSVIHFSTRLARTNFYLIEWARADESLCALNGQRQAVWSAGAGDFLQADGGTKFEGTRQISLAHGAISSGGATLTVPEMFFDLTWESRPFDDLVFSMTRHTDEKIGDCNCYVFTRGAMGATNTLWIGKQDFLIHQVRLVANKDSLPSITLTETHTNIVLNRKFTREDFIPTFPLSESAVNQ
ncbi:MAG TPA: hypothetical protein VL970_09100 [Candidatus Acidoferrales bacterium]|nr:hypothetical protein [Candidatus Acidoferrales bacterium]